MTQDILAFWLFLAYADDLLEDGRTIDVINSKFFPSVFKMAEKFENLDTILRDWGKIKYKKGLVELGIEKVRESGRRKKKPFLF